MRLIDYFFALMVLAFAATIIRFIIEFFDTPEDKTGHENY